MNLFNNYHQDADTLEQLKGMLAAMEKLEARNNEILVSKPYSGIKRRKGDQQLPLIDVEEIETIEISWINQVPLYQL